MAYIGRSISGDPALVVREQNKEERRSRILGAAEKLIRELGTVEFSMRELAARAHISHYTSYNLIGNTGTVLYTLLHRAIDRITNLPSQADPNFDPLTYAFAMGDLAVAFYVPDQEFFMPLLRFILVVSDAQSRPNMSHEG